MIHLACAAIVTDIEGTVGSIAFVRTVLFPYASLRLRDYIDEHGNDATVRALLAETANLAGEPDADDARLVAILHAWIAEDRKATPLKALQGMIWREGYERGAFAGHVYADAAAALRAWHEAGMTLAVYSSGSVPAQKLLFGHSVAGDLTPLFSAYFDTTIGAKTESGSYAAIAGALGHAPAHIAFLSDHEGELDAAAAIGMQTVRLLRANDTPADTETRHPSASSFDELRVSLDYIPNAVVGT